MEAVLEAVKRSTTGKNENNRTRAAGQIPGVVYGAQKAGDAVAAIAVAVAAQLLQLREARAAATTVEATRATAS